MRARGGGATSVVPRLRYAIASDTDDAKGAGGAGGGREEDDEDNPNPGPDLLTSTYVVRGAGRAAAGRGTVLLRAVGGAVWGCDGWEWNLLGGLSMGGGERRGGER